MLVCASGHEIVLTCLISQTLLLHMCMHIHRYTHEVCISVLEIVAIQLNAN